MAMALRKIMRWEEDTLTPEELAEWYSRLSWEKELDMQKEIRLRREAVFWHDPTLDDLDEQDKMWEIIQMGFQQVEDVLDSIDLAHYRDYFLSKGVLYGAKMRGMTRKFMDKRMPAITNEHEKELILEACANACKDDTIRLFPFRYGNPEALLEECHEGKRFLSERMHQGWLDKVNMLTYPLVQDHNATNQKLPEKDRQSFDDYDSWVACADSTGRIYLFPQDEESKVPPCVRNPRNHQKAVLDFAVDWENMRCVSAGVDGIIVFHDLKTDEPQHMLMVAGECNLSAVHDFWSTLDVDFQLGKMSAGLSSGHVQLVDLQVGKAVYMFPCHNRLIRRVATDWAANELASCSYDGCINLSDLRTGKVIRQIQGRGQWDAMDVSFDQHLLLASSKFKPATMLCDLRTGKIIQEYELSDHRPNWISVNWATKTACTGADDGKVKLWQLDTGEVSRTIDCDHFLTQSLDICWSRGLLLTGSFDYQFKMWDVTTGDLLKQFVAPRRCVTRVLLQ